MDPETVREQYELVRRSGRVNMMNRTAVREVARGRGFTELVDYIDESSMVEYLETGRQAGRQKI